MNDSKKCDEFLETLVETNIQPLLNYGFNLIGRDGQYIFCVEECVQETFLDAYESCERLMNHPNIKGWLRVTLRNNIAKQMKKERQMSSISTVWKDNLSIHDASKVDEIESFLRDEFNRSEVERALFKLNQKERTLVTDYYFDGKSVKDIASENGTTPGVINVQLHRIRQKLKRIMKYTLLLLMFLSFMRLY